MKIPRAKTSGTGGPTHSRRSSVRRWRRAIVLFQVLVLLAGYLPMVTAPPALAALPEPEEIFYIPLPEATVEAAITSLAIPTTGTMTGVISITAASDGTIVYYDHWEDGFDASMNAPTPGTSQVWGDSDPSNGIPPGYATDLIDAGDVIILQNNVPLPRNPANVYFDGGDKLGATSPIAVTRAVWDFGTGTVAAGAVEVASTKAYGTSFEAPVGQDFAFPSGFDPMFEYTSLIVTAAQAGPTVSIDIDADGTPDVSTTLGQGQTYQVDGGVLTGATVTASAPVQAQLITGNAGGPPYEMRFFALVPASRWSSTYYTPVGSAGTHATTVFLYNPHATSLTVNADTLSGTTPITIPAGSTATYVMPSNSGGRFSSSDGRPFQALSGVDTELESHRQRQPRLGHRVVPDPSLRRLRRRPEHRSADRPKRKPVRPARRRRRLPERQVLRHGQR
jgi:hypothetical protein